MKRVLLAVALVLAVVPAAVAQNSTPIHPPIFSYLDAPSANARVTPDVRFGGWAFNCKTGRHVASIVLSRVDASGRIAILPATVHWGPRPDVQTYARLGGCSMPELALGFTIVPNDPQPFGVYDYVLLITDMQRDPDAINWSAIIHRTVLVQ